MLTDYYLSRASCEYCPSEIDVALGEICIRLNFSLHIVARNITSLESKTEIQLRAKSNLKAFVFPTRPLSFKSKAGSPRATFNVHLKDYELYTKLIKFLTSRLANDRYIKRMSANHGKYFGKFSSLRAIFICLLTNEFVFVPNNFPLSVSHKLCLRFFADRQVDKLAYFFFLCVTFLKFKKISLSSKWSLPKVNLVFYRVK